MLNVHRCPSSNVPAFSQRGYQHMYASYCAVAGSVNDLNAYSVNCGGIVSDHGIMGRLATTKISNVTDGTSNTVLLGEQSNDLRDANNNVVLGNTYGGPVGISITAMGPDGLGEGCPISGLFDIYNISTARYPINYRTAWSLGSGGVCDNVGVNIPFSSQHAGGAHFLYADGSVHFLSDNMNLQTFFYACNRDDGQNITLE